MDILKNNIKKLVNKLKKIRGKEEELRDGERKGSDWKLMEYPFVLRHGGSHPSNQFISLRLNFPNSFHY